MIKVQMFKDKAKKWRWRLRSKGRILSTSEAYSSKTQCRDTAKSVCGGVISPLVEDMEAKQKK